MIKVEDENNEVRYEGYCVDLIEEIKKLVGFEYEIYVAPDNKFGNMDENGQWNGMIKELIEKVRILFFLFLVLWPYNPCENS